MLGLAPSPFLSWPAPPPRALGKEGHAVEQRPSPPLSKGRCLLLPWQMEEWSRSGRRGMVKDCGMPSPTPSYKGAGSRLSQPTQPIPPSRAQGIGTDPPLQLATAWFPALLFKVLPPTRSLPATSGARGTCGEQAEIKGTGEATVLQRVITGRGRLEDHDPSPLSK